MLVVRIRFVDTSLVLLFELLLDCGDVDRLRGVLCTAHGDQPRLMGTCGALEATVLWRIPFCRATSGSGSGASAHTQAIKSALTTRNVECYSSK